jgi:hypothetical protein
LLDFAISETPRHCDSSPTLQPETRRSKTPNTKMVIKIFQNSPTRELALQRLGAAILLQWSNLPPALQDDLVQQALALSDDMVEVHREIERLTRMGARSPKDRGSLRTITSRVDGTGRGAFWPTAARRFVHRQQLCPSAAVPQESQG